MAALLVFLMAQQDFSPPTLRPLSTNLTEHLHLHQLPAIATRCVNKVHVMVALRSSTAAAAPRVPKVSSSICVVSTLSSVSLTNACPGYIHQIRSVQCKSVLLRIFVSIPSPYCSDHQYFRSHTCQLELEAFEACWLRSVTAAVLRFWRIDTYLTLGTFCPLYFRPPGAQAGCRYSSGLAFFFLS